MENKYWINRNDKNTINIRVAVTKMNKDMYDLSKYCDKLEHTIMDLVNVMGESLNDKFIREKLNMSIEEFKKFILERIFEKHGSKR